MNKIERSISNKVCDAVNRMGEGGYKVDWLGGHTSVARGFSLSRRPRVSVKLYDTYILQATGAPHDYELDIDLSYLSHTTLSRVNAALDGLGLGVIARQMKGKPAVFVDGKLASTDYCTTLRVKGGEVLA